MSRLSRLSRLSRFAVLSRLISRIERARPRVEKNVTLVTPCSRSVTTRRDKAILACHAFCHALGQVGGHQIGHTHAPHFPTCSPIRAFATRLNACLFAAGLSLSATDP